jgi:hypothetical protein
MLGVVLGDATNKHFVQLCLPSPSAPDVKAFYQ